MGREMKILIGHMWGTNLEPLICPKALNFLPVETKAEDVTHYCMRSVLLTHTGRRKTKGNFN